MVKPYYNSDKKLLYLNTKVIKDLGKEPNYFFALAIEESDLELLRLINRGKKEPSTESLEAFDTFIYKYDFLNEFNIISYGNANKNTSYRKFAPFLEVDTRKSIAENRLKETVVYFRNYEKSYEKWQANIPFINSCPDYIMCWQSLIRKLGAKNVRGLNNKYEPFYILIFSVSCFNNDLENLKKEWKL